MVDDSNEGEHEHEYEYEYEHEYEHEEAAEFDSFVGSIDRQLAVLRMENETMTDGSGYDPADAYIYRPVSRSE